MDAGDEKAPEKQKYRSVKKSVLAVTTTITTTTTFFVLTNKALLAILSAQGETRRRMPKKDDSDHLIVVDVERYRKVKKALEESKAGKKESPYLDEKESTRELVVVDVNRYKRVKKALEASEKRYQHLFENVPIGIYRTTPDGRIVDANPALVKMLGYDGFAELAKRSLEGDAFEPGYRRADFVRRLRQDGQITGLEAGWKRRDGSLIHVRENAKLVQGEDGQVFFEGTVEDITQSKLDEEARRVHTRQLEILHDLISSGNLADSMTELLDSILEIVARVLDFDQAQVYFHDPVAGRLFPAASRGVPRKFHLDDRYLALGDNPIGRVIRRGEAAFFDQDDLKRHELARKWGWHMAASVPLLSKGRVVGALNVASRSRGAFSSEEKNTLLLVGKEAGTLISKLQTETALRESEKYYRTLIQTSPDFVFALGLDGTMTTVNQRFLEVTGFASDEIVGHSVLELVGEMAPDLLRDGMETLARSGAILQYEHPVRRKDGGVFPMEMSLSVLTDAGGAPSGIMGVGRDISERKRAEEAQRLRIQQIEILNCIISKGNLAGSLSELLEVVLDCVVQPLHFDNAGIFMLDPEGKRVLVKARRGPSTDFSQCEKYMAIDGKPFSQVLLGGQPLYVDDAARRQPEFFEKWGWSMAASVPLLSKGLVVGALNVASRQRCAFTPEERETLEMIGKEAGTLVSKLQTEAALRESEKYYRTLIDTSPDIVAVMDLEARLLTVNQQFLKAGGYSSDEVIGVCAFDFIAGLSREMLERQMAEFIASLKAVGSEYIFRHKDGQTVPLDVSAGFLFDDAGKPMGIIAIGRDVSERKRAEEALRDSEEKFRSIAEQTSDLIAVTDAAGVITYASPSARTIFQYAPEEMRGRNFVEFLDPPSAPKALAAFRSDQKPGSRSIGLELAMRRRDGTVFAGELNGSSFHYGDQHGSLVVIRDISPRRQAEEELRFLSSITENTTDAIMVTDTGFRITYVNKVAEQFFGYPLAELQGKTPGLFNVDPDAERIQQRIYETVARGDTYLGESLNRRKDGSTFYCEYKVMPLRGADGRIRSYFSVQRDISERKLSEEVLRQSEETFRRTFAAIPSPAYIWARQEDGRVTLDRFNRAAEAITHGRIREYQGIDDDRLYADRPEFARKIRLTMESGQALNEEVKYRYQSTGEEKWLVVDYVSTAPGRVMVITRDISERKEAEARLLAYQEQLRALSSELTLVEERERRRIASDLHDQIGQNLALCKLKVAALEKEPGTDAVRSELSAVRRLLECSIQDARSLIFDLSPPILYELGFLAALEWLADRITEQYRVAVEFENQAGALTLETDRGVILFQVVRELLVNVGKHSRAGRAKVIVAQGDGVLRIQVNDDGQGFDASRAYDRKEREGGFGFFSMRERLNYLGGAIEIRSKPGVGTQVFLTLPLPPRPAGEPGRNKP